MTLTLRGLIPFEEVISHLDMIPDTLLLFLPTLKEIKVRIRSPNHRSTITTCRKSTDGDTGFECLIKNTNDSEEELQYYVTRKCLDCQMMLLDPASTTAK